MESRIDTLPLEVLSEIFLLATDPRRIKYAVLLSSVCASWRAAIIRRPLFWRKIVHSSYSKIPVELVNLMLERSKPCSLVIFIGLGGDPSDDSNRLLSLIAEHCERWKEVEFWMPSTHYDSLVSIRGRLPLLETLDIESDTSISSFSGFELAPALQSLRVGPLVLFDRNLIAKLLAPYSQLTRLVLIPSDPSVLLSILAHTPKLIELTFCRRVSAEQLRSVSLPVTLCHLSTLSIDSESCHIPGEPDPLDQPGDILCFITTPALSCLELLYGGGCFRCAKDLIIRSHCSLKSLSLCVETCNSEIVSLLETAPRFEHLKLVIDAEHDDVTGDVLDSMLPGAEVFSKLRELYYTWEESGRDPEEYQLYMLTARAV